MFSKLIPSVVLTFGCPLLVGCTINVGTQSVPESSATTANSSQDMQQIRDACSLVGLWPEWVYTMWPKTVERAIAKGTDGGEDMAQFVRSSAAGFELTDRRARQIVEDYATYWVLLNKDLAATGGVPPSADSVSTREFTRLFEGCEKLLGTIRF